MKNFFNDDSGATAIEYGLIAVLVSLLIITGATGIGAALAPIFQTAANAITP